MGTSFPLQPFSPQKQLVLSPTTLQLNSSTIIQEKKHTMGQNLAVKVLQTDISEI